MPEKKDWAPPSWMGDATPQAPESDLGDPGHAAGVGGGAQPSTDTFTLPVQEIPRRREHLDQEAGPPPARRRGARQLRPPVRAAIALPMLILLGLISSFFSWVSVEPLWLTVGHGTHGIAKITQCTGSGLTQRCAAEFTPDQPGAGTVRVTVTGISPAAIKPGSQVPAQTVNERSHRAYAGQSFALRWLLGIGAVLLCGVGIVLASGVLRLPERRERLMALGASFAAPFMITIGFLAASF